MKKSVIEVGQCYSYHDRVFMVLAAVAPSKEYKFKMWLVEDTLIKTLHRFSEIFLSDMRRPFQNFG